MVNQSVQSSFLAPFFIAMTMASEIAPSPEQNCQHRSQDEDEDEDEDADDEEGRRTMGRIEQLGGRGSGKSMMRTELAVWQWERNEAAAAIRFCRCHNKFMAHHL